MFLYIKESEILQSYDEKVVADFSKNNISTMISIIFLLNAIVIIKRYLIRNFIKKWIHILKYKHSIR